MRCHWPIAAILLAAPAATAGDVSVTKGTDSIEFRADGATVAKYHVGAAVAKPYLWPVLAPGNVPVTRGWPMEASPKPVGTEDHVHQKSAWFCHGDVIPEGVELKIKSSEAGGKGVNFWSEAVSKDGTRGY